MEGPVKNKQMARPYAVHTSFGVKNVKRVYNLREESSLNMCTGRLPTGVMIPDAV
jgi:hypothetical protein